MVVVVVLTLKVGVLLLMVLLVAVVVRVVVVRIVGGKTRVVGVVDADENHAKSIKTPCTLHYPQLPAPTTVA